MPVFVAFALGRLSDHNGHFGSRIELLELALWDNVQAFGAEYAKIRQIWSLPHPQMELGDVGRERAGGDTVANVLGSR